MSAVLEEPVVEEEFEVEVISVVEMGRIVHLLRGEQRWATSNKNYWNRTRTSLGRRFSDDQLRRVLGLTTVELDEYQAAYQATYKKWSTATQIQVTVAFAKKHQRWPTKTDYDRDPTLPASSTWYSTNGPTHLNRWLREPKNSRNLHPSLLLGIRNVTVRQEVIEAAGGIERLVKRGAATKFQEDGYGILWEMPPEPGITEKKAVWLEVVNATVEENGEAEHFFLRVPPTVATAKEAVEWSFSIPTGELVEFAAET